MHERHVSLRRGNAKWVYRRMIIAIALGIVGPVSGCTDGDDSNGARHSHDTANVESKSGDIGAPTNSNTSDFVVIEFPHPPGVLQRLGERVALSVPSENAVAGIFVVDVTSAPMEFAQQYVSFGDSFATGLRHAGWETLDNRTDEYVASATLVNRSTRQIAVNLFASGAAFAAGENFAEAAPVLPFYLDSDLIGPDQTLIYTLVFTCLESVPDECVGPVLPNLDPFK